MGTRPRLNLKPIREAPKETFRIKQAPETEKPKSILDRIIKPSDKDKDKAKRALPASSETAKTENKLSKVVKKFRTNKEVE